MKTRLSEIITSRGLERKVIARDLGIEKRTLDNYINENTLMNSDMIKKMAAYLNVSTDYLLDYTIENNFVEEKVDEITSLIKEIIYHINK